MKVKIKNKDHSCGIYSILLLLQAARVTPSRRDRNTTYFFIKLNETSLISLADKMFKISKN